MLLVLLIPKVWLSCYYLHNLLYILLYIIADDKIGLGAVHPAHQVVFVNSNFSIECGSYTIPSWYKRGSSEHILADNHTLQLNTVQEADSGVYVCWGTLLKKDKKVTFKASSEILIASNRVE